MGLPWASTFFGEREGGGFFCPWLNGIMENNMETTIVYWGLYGINGKEAGNHYSIFIVYYSE